MSTWYPGLALAGQPASFWTATSYLCGGTTPSFGRRLREDPSQLAPDACPVDLRYFPLAPHRFEKYGLFSAPGLVDCIFTGSCQVLSSLAFMSSPLLIDLLHRMMMGKPGLATPKYPFFLHYTSFPRAATSVEDGFTTAFVFFFFSYA